jgi:hypothetical protein
MNKLYQQMNRLYEVTIHRNDNEDDIYRILNSKGVRKFAQIHLTLYDCNDQNLPLIRGIFTSNGLTIVHLTLKGSSIKHLELNLNNCVIISQEYSVTKILESLPPLPKCEELSCRNNLLVSLPKLPKCKILDCQNNNLTSLPDLPECVKLDCEKNQLTSLPNLPKCEKLNCKKNQIVKLPKLNNVTSLYCENNNLSGLLTLPNVKTLYCSNNNLTVIKNLPNCEHISCDNNQLVDISNIPQCDWLDCSTNQLTELPDLLKCKRLNCSNNRLKRLPSLPVVQVLKCSNNELEFIPTINNVIRELEIKGNRKYKLNCKQIKELNPTITYMVCDDRINEITIPTPMKKSQFNFSDTSFQFQEEEKKMEEEPKLEFIAYINDASKNLNDEDTLNHVSRVLFDGLLNNDYTINEVIELLPELNEYRLVKIYENIFKNTGFMTRVEYESLNESEEINELLRILYQKQEHSWNKKDIFSQFEGMM